LRPEDVPAGPLAIDTDAFSFVHARKGPHAEFAALIVGHPLAMPFPVVGELKVGAIRGGIGEKKLSRLEAAIAACTVIPADARVVNEWAALRAKLVNRLAGEGINDIWIAACCLVHGLPLVTNNLEDFNTIAMVRPALRIVHPER
jgi:predicted nucleic acid-binding protein